VVVRERLRIDGELRQTVGAALEAIALQGERAGSLALRNRSAAEQVLRALVDAARKTLSDARRMVTRYQEPSLRAELETVATLLAAAGIQSRMVLPPVTCRTVSIRPRGRCCDATLRSCSARGRSGPP
jgi:two-component system sensor histidine kinase DesK